MPSRAVQYDLRMAARSHSDEGMKILMECMRDRKADWGTRLKAIELLWERGYGKPEIRAAIDNEHRFVIAPNTMQIDEWLANKGQPTNNAWLQEQQRKAGALAAPPEERRTGEAAASKEEHSVETLDLKPEPVEPEPKPKDQPAPTVDPKRLN
jgi:hypothetical protein